MKNWNTEYHFMIKPDMHIGDIIDDLDIVLSKSKNNFNTDKRKYEIRTNYEFGHLVYYICEIS